MAVERPSKSAQKRAAMAIRALADELVELKPGLLAKVIDNEDVDHAVREAQAINSFGALRRQKQYIARLLRDADVDRIRMALQALQADDTQDKKRFRAAERLRDAMLKADASTRSELLTQAGLETTDALRDALQRHATSNDARARKNASRSVFRVLYEALALTQSQSREDNKDNR